MDEITQNSEIAQRLPAFAALFAIILVVIVVLALVVLRQNQKINELQRPKFGFLGKPLNAFFLMALSIGGLGFVYYNANNTTQEFTEVSADTKLDVNIVVTQTNNFTEEYQLRAIPIIDDVEWGGVATYSFDVYWTITNGDVQTAVDLGLTQDKTGGVNVKLKPGSYIIKASIFTGDRKIEKETRFIVE